MLALQLEPLYAAEAKRRQQLSQGRGVKGSQKSDNLNSPIRTDEQLAKLAGTSRDTIRKVKVIETEAAKGNETAVKVRDELRMGVSQSQAESNGKTHDPLAMNYPPEISSGRGGSCRRFARSKCGRDGTRPAHLLQNRCSRLLQCNKNESR